MMNNDGGVQSVLCIDPPEATYLRLRDEAWARTGLLRWHRVASTQSADVIAKAQGSSHILIFVNPDVNPIALWTVLVKEGYQYRIKFVSTVPKSIRPQRDYGDLPRPVSVDRVLAAIMPDSRVAEIEWRGSDEGTRVAKERFAPEQLQLVLQKLFPGWTGKASFDTVDGGRSGAPLLQMFRTDKADEFYLKFFDDHTAFTREWDGHRRAKAWLGDCAVDLQPVSMLDEAGDKQAEAFPRLPAVSCFKAAKVLTRLKDLYVRRDDRFILQAYVVVLEAFNRHQPKSQRSVVLSNFQDIGPVGPSGPAPSLLASLRSPGQRNTVLAALDSLRPYAASSFVGERIWQALSGQLWALLITIYEVAVGLPLARFTIRRARISSIQPSETRLRVSDLRPRP